MASSRQASVKLRNLVIVPTVALSLQGCEFFENLFTALQRLCDQPVYVVTTTEDDRDALCAPAHCSLFDAFATAHGCGGEHVIRLADGADYQLSRPRHYIDSDEPDEEEQKPFGDSALAPVVGRITLEGNGSKIRRTGDSNYRLIEVFETGELIVRRTWFEGGKSGEGGGAIRNSGGSLTIEESTFHGNKGSVGGAIFNNGNLHVVRSLFSENTPIGGGTGGGAIWSDGGSVSVHTSTFSENAAQLGGAILLNANHGLGEIRDSTFVGNRSRSGAFQALADSGPIRLVNSAFQSGMDGPNCSIAASANVMVRRSNISDDDSCDFTLRADDLMLRSLANIGGPTRGYLPSAGSPVIDAGPETASATGGNACLPTDQRGDMRPQGAACDIGSVEAR